jgi:4-amino-4-deoxy-L-arabinose transferase-like glycosyltransferase
LKSDLTNNRQVTFITKGWPEGLLLFAAALVLLFWGIGDRSLWASEGRWAEITREMFISGDFFHPTIGGEPYFDKPLLTYWLIAAFSAITGRLDELIIRLPGALAALVTLACTVYLGRRLWSAQIGALAGGLLATSYGLLMYSHVASAETENLAAVMLAVTWYWTRRDRPGFMTFLVFYLIMFVGSHTKGLTAFVVPVLAVLPDFLRPLRGRWLLWASHWLALGIGVAVYYAPFVYAALTRPESYQQSGLSLVLQENILRYVRPFDHKGPIYLYLVAVPLLTLPWVPILIGALVASISSWKKLDGDTRWLIQAIAIIFAFFTLSGSRRSYYILPILPFCTLLMAVFLVELGQEVVGTHRDRSLRIQKHALIITAVLELVLGPAAVWFLVSKRGWELPSLLGWSFLFVALAALLAGAVAYKLSNRLPHGGRLQTIWALILIAGVLQGGFFAWQYNILDFCRTERPFALRLKGAVGSLSHERVAFVHRCEDKLLFYMKWDPRATLLADENALRAFLESDEPGIVISQDRYITETAASMLPSQPAYAEVRYTWESPDVCQKKLKAWLINANRVAGFQPAIRGRDALDTGKEANSAK